MSLRRLGPSAALAFLLVSAAARADAPPPVAEIRNVPETFFGTTVDDPYRYFEDAKAPAVPPG